MSRESEVGVGVMKGRGATKGKKCRQPRKRGPRPTREEAKKRRLKYRTAQRALREKQLLEGLCPIQRTTATNSSSCHKTQEEEAAERQRVVAAFIASVRPQLPALLQALSNIKDPRDPKKITHQFALVMFYGIMCFVFQMQSRREGNRDLSGPVLVDHLRQIFPEIEGLPHHDTVNRILTEIDVEEIQDVHMAMIKRLIRNKKFNRFLINGHYPIAIDGTQKLLSNSLISPEWQERTYNKETPDEHTKYNVYVLEAHLSFANGLTLPLLSEFLNYEEGDNEAKKQDCETKAFQRLAKRLKENFPRLPIIVLLDGLYPNGPIFETCRQHHWDFMIVLKDGSLPSIWTEFSALKPLEPGNRAERTAGVRRQIFQCVNDIEYFYGDDKKFVKLHVVECQERWDVVDSETSELALQTSRHVWTSNKPLTKQNLHERCNLAARHRWNIEEAILAEKRHGYQYEHGFSKDWKALKGYHYLMHLGRALNVLAQYSEALVDFVQTKGVRAAIKFIRDSLVHPWISPAELLASLPDTPQLRLA